MLKWYMKRYDILFETVSDIWVLLKLREHSDPAETLKKIEERLAEARLALGRLDQTTKELKDDKENS